jgi:sarcosine oxidase
MEVGVLVSTHPHVIVLGLGIAGSSIAAELAQRGFRVTGIEQFAPLHERGSSHGDTRIFRRVPHEGEVYVNMAAASLEGWRRWSRQANDELLVECGGIDAGPQESGTVKAAEELCRQYHQPCQIYDGGAFNDRYPYFHIPRDWRIVYQPSSGFVRPDATRVFLHEAARAAGATLLHGARVLRIDYPSDGVRVHISEGTISGDMLIVSAGSWLPTLCPELQVSLSVERRVLAWYQPQSPAALADGRLPIFVLDAGGGWYGMPTPDGQIKIGHDKHRRQGIDPENMPFTPDALDQEVLVPCIREYFRGFHTKPNAMKSCIYTLTQDHNFLIDWHPAHANTLIVSCCSGHGFKYAPAYGEIAADLLSGKERPELKAFGLNRGSAAATRFSD